MRKTTRLDARFAILVLTISICVPALASETLLFEDFDDGVADFFAPTDPTWQVENGMYRCDLTGVDRFSLARAGDYQWTDYVVECDVRVEGSLNNVLAFRIRDDWDFYDINIIAAPFNAVVLSKRIDNSDVWHVAVPYDNVVGDWHHIRVAVVDDVIDVSIDGRSVINHRDSLNPYRTGGIAPVGYCGNAINFQTAWFDNVVVYTIEPIATDQDSWDGVKALFR